MSLETPGMFATTMAWAGIVGAVGFCGGFFGPMIFTPEANQGPLLGLFITGPLGFVAGAIGGLTYSFGAGLDRSNVSAAHLMSPQSRGALGPCMASVLDILLKRRRSSAGATLSRLDARPRRHPRGTSVSFAG